MSQIYHNVMKAEQKIRSHIRETPLDYSHFLSQLTGTQTYLKCEHMQHTGAFKVRGAFNKLLSLSASQKQWGVVTASSGNHGAAVGYVCTKLNIPGLVFVPENASKAKINNIQQYQVSLDYYSNDCMQTEIYAREFAKKTNKIYVSPYNDIDIIGGQGTISIELFRQLTKIDAVFVPIGGGGLISGIAGYIKTVSPHTKIIGCLPINSPVMSESIKAGKIVEIETFSTISDATAGGIEPDAMTFGFCQNYVDDYVSVSEDEIKAAILNVIQYHRYLVEGASGVALAGLIKSAEQYKGKNCVVILSGGNMSVDTLKMVLEHA